MVLARILQNLENRNTAHAKFTVSCYVRSNSACPFPPFCLCSLLICRLVATESVCEVQNVLLQVLQETHQPHIMPSARPCEQACMALSRHGRSCERVLYKRIHACRVVGRVRAGSVRILHPLLVVFSLARLCFPSLPPGGGSDQVVLQLRVRVCW